MKLQIKQLDTQILQDQAWGESPLTITHAAHSATLATPTISSVSEVTMLC